MNKAESVNSMMQEWKMTLTSAKCLTYAGRGRSLQEIFHINSILLYCFEFSWGVSSLIMCLNICFSSNVLIIPCTIFIFTQLDFASPATSSALEIGQQTYVGAEVKLPDNTEIKINASKHFCNIVKNSERR
ncbi:hypothetical protein V6N13_036312 [Hibiscus sabdariffa]|uniref:Uncharacterized protein n=1 Tax=Hibiscus sabdariffa TaxID=183260 RepID=A0ABR2S6R5_9ROSI